MVKIILIVCLIIFMINKANGGEFFHRFHKTYDIKSTYTNNRTISVGLVLINITKYREILPSDLAYNQVLSYSKQEPFGDEHGRSTNAHETVHGINNELRNYYKTSLKKNVNAFYAGEGMGVIVENPNITMKHIIPYIPKVLMGYRYNMYFVKQINDWNSVPTYPIDEWSAYIAGAECAVNDTINDIATEKSDCVSGSLEFSIYCTALALAVKNNDPDYWRNNKQFKNTLQYFLIKSEKVFFEGQDIFPSVKQDKLLENLRHHDDAKELRDFLVSEFQGVFID